MTNTSANAAADDNTLKTLWVLLSALGLLIIVGTAGFFFFSPDKGTEELKPQLAATAIAPQEKEAPEEIDPIKLLRESDEYPGLEEEGDEIAVELEVLPEDTAPAAEETVSKPEPAPVVQAPVPEPPRYKEVTVQAYWIQVGSYSSMTKAESVSAYMKEKGMSSTVQTKKVDGNAVFRVRIGAFNTKEEAEKFSSQVKSIKGYEESFVIQSPLVKKVPISG
jgi:cell division protein FtsN